MSLLKKDKKYIPYIITIYGTLDTEKEGIEEMRKELGETNIQYLINIANSKYIEINEDELLRQKEI